jgi:hypothetical protein
MTKGFVWRPFCLQPLDHWSTVPGKIPPCGLIGKSGRNTFCRQGDSTDTSLKPASGQTQRLGAQDETRFSDQITVTKYLDHEFVVGVFPVTAATILSNNHLSSRCLRLVMLIS